MNRPDADFRDFVVGFADPLARLAFLLMVGTARPTSEDATIDALAQVRRHWHEADVSGAPESLALEALLGSLPPLPNARHIPHLHHSPPPPHIPSVSPARAGGVGQAAVAADLQSIETSREELLESIWAVWMQLPPRERVPLLFADASVASRRLVGLDVPESFASPRRYELIARAALHGMRVGLAARGLATEFDDAELADLVTEALREQGLSAPVPVDPYPSVDGRVRRGRHRTACAVSAVVAVLIAGTATATVMSRPPAAKPAASTGTPSTGSPRAVPTSGHAALTQPGLVVDWPTRGNAATNAQLISALETDFVHAHPDATGQVQVLLAVDTPAFRLAYVTANSAKGVMQSWYFGPVASTRLSEGAFSYGPALSADSVIATVLSDTGAHTELVVIAPPDADNIELTNIDPSVAVQRLASSNGVGVEDVSKLVAANLVVTVTRGPIVLFSAPAVLEQLVPSDDATAVENGSATPDLLTAAMVAADTWRRTGALGGPASRVPLWGGTDPSGIQLVIVRLRTDSLVHGLVVEWTNDPDITNPADRMIPASRDEEISPSAPDVPLAFSYDVSRVGVLVPPTIASTVLVVDGQDEPPVKVDAHGFASMPVRDQHGLLSEQTLRVDLYDLAGHIAGTVPVADAVP